MIPVAAKFSLAFSRARGKVIVHIDGALNTNNAGELEDRLVDLIEGQGNRHLVLDIRKMTSIDSAGLSVLSDALRRVQESGGALILSGPQTKVALALTAARLGKVFEITPGWEHPVYGHCPPER